MVGAVSPRVRAIAAFSGVFLLGVVTGGAVMRGVGPKGPPHEAFEGGSILRRQKAFLRHLDREVSLDPGQREAVRTILAAHEPEARAVHESVRPRMNAIRSATIDEVRRVMRPDQLADYQRFVEKMDARARGDEDGPPDMPPPRRKGRWRDRE